MFKALLTIFAVLAVFHILEATVPPAGKCKDVTPIPVDFNLMAQTFKYWKSLYVPRSKAFINIDSEFREIHEFSYNTLIGSSKTKSKDNSVSSYLVTLTYGNDLIIYEEGVDDNGGKTYFKWIPIYLSNQYALLFYRCSDTGSLNIDTRYVIIPIGYTLSDAEEQQVLEADKDRNFVGDIRKLKRALE